MLKLMGPHLYEEEEITFAGNKLSTLGRVKMALLLRCVLSNKIYKQGV